MRTAVLTGEHRARRETKCRRALRLLRYDFLRSASAIEISTLQKRFWTAMCRATPYSIQIPTEPVVPDGYMNL
jgi:hypothetical protein